MDKKKILKEFNKIFMEVLDDPDIKIKESTTAADIPEWDSLTHIQLVVAIEKFFSIRFSSIELQNYKNVGQMCAAVSKKIKK